VNYEENLQAQKALLKLASNCAARLKRYERFSTTKDLSR